MSKVNKALKKMADDKIEYERKILFIDPKEKVIYMKGFKEGFKEGFEAGFTMELNVCQSCNYKEEVEGKKKREGNKDVV